MDTQHDHDEIHYLVSNAGVGLAPETRCAHGDTAVIADLTGTPCKPGALPDHIETLIPRCGFAHMIGSVIAQIRHLEGEGAAEHFRDQVRLAESVALHRIQQPSTQEGTTRHGS